MKKIIRGLFMVMVFALCICKVYAGPAVAIAVAVPEKAVVGDVYSFLTTDSSDIESILWETSSDTIELLETDQSTVHFRARHAGEACVSVKISFSEGYTGVGRACIEIFPKQMDNLYFENIGNYAYTGKSITPELLLKDDDNILVEGRDYTVKHINNDKIGEAKVEVTGMGDYTGTIGKSYKILVSIPRSLRVHSITESTIRINWNKPNALVTGYEVFYSTSRDGEYKSVYKTTSNTATTYLRKNLTPGTSAYFKVRSYYVENGKTYYSNNVSIAATTMPARPAISSVESGLNTVKVSWKKVPDASGYVLSRATSKNGPYTKVATFTSGNAVSYSDKGLDAATTYYYKIVAYKNFNDERVYGYFSTPVVISTKPRTTGLELKGNKNSATLIWNRLRGISGYEIYYATSKNGTYTKLKTITNINTTTYKKTGLSASKNYYFKVRAYRIVNGKKYYGDFSNVAYRLK